MTTRILLGAIAACLCLAAGLWLYAALSSHEGSSQPMEIAIPDVSGIRFEANGNYPTMLERPLFWPERAPVQPGEEQAASAEGAAAGPDGLVYLGVLVKGDERQVLLRDGDGVHVLREGERIRGLEIKRINAEGVVLAGNSGEVHLPVPVDNAETIEIRRME